MKISHLNFPEINIQTKVNKPAKQNSYVNNDKLLSYPKNYYISFGTRGIDEIDVDLMPTTLVEYIKNNPGCENKTLKEVQQSAFKELKNCHSLKEIKEKFPNEKYFKSMLDENEVKPENRKYVFVNADGDLVPDESKGGVKEPIQCYFIREVFFKCKKYIEISDELNEYISGISNTKLHKKMENLYGIAIPDGRKYNPTLTAGEGKEYRISEATRQKLIASAKKRWEDLSDEEKTEKIAKLQTGSKKQKAIMINAWNKIFNSGTPMRQNLSSYLSENLRNGSFSSMLDSVQGLDDENISNKTYMSKLMTEFWEKYPSYAELLGKYIEQATAEYEAQCPGDVENKDYIRHIYDEQNKINQEMKKWKLQQPMSENELKHDFESSLMKFIREYISE